ncbi:unnamed protein product, partial [marine sediment metagenome]
PLLGKHHDYMIIWGYWNAPDELLAVRDEDIYKGINASDVLKEGLIAESVYRRVMQAARRRLLEVGIEDLNPSGTHLLLSLDKSGRLVTDRQGMPTVRVCNFELLRRGKP